TPPTPASRSGRPASRPGPMACGAPPRRPAATPARGTTAPTSPRSAPRACGRSPQRSATPRTSSSRAATTAAASCSSPIATPAAQAAPGSGGGVIGLDRDYAGVDLRWRFDRRDAQTRFTATAGLSSDWQDEQRKGWENFLGTAAAPTAPGVIGRLRRDETNNARTLDPYAQLEWERSDWTASAGLRHSQVRLDSEDHFIATGNADDSGSARYS